MTYQTSHEGLERIRQQMLDKQREEASRLEKISEKLQQMAASKPRAPFRIPVASEAAVIMMQAMAESYSKHQE